MKWLGIAVVVIVVAGVTLVAVSRLTAAELKPGQPAPDFKLKGSDGKTYHLADFKGKRAVVVAWFPKAFTPGCTQECKSFAKDGDALKAFDVAYFTASVDPPDKNKEFAKSLKVDYPILSDLDGKVARAYGVTDAVKKWASRWTFYIGVDGKILYIDKDVKTATHATDVAAKLKELGVAKRKEKEKEKEKEKK